MKGVKGVCRIKSLKGSKLQMEGINIASKKSMMKDWRCVQLAPACTPRFLCIMPSHRAAKYQRLSGHLHN
jgi:hypothetical protein